MMEWFNILRARLRAMFRRERVLRDIEEELRVHVEMETETNIKRGAPPDEARAAALKSFGDPCRNTERGYDIRGGGWIETFWQDAPYGLHQLCRSASVTPARIITHAPSLGAATPILSLADSSNLRPVRARGAST